MLNLFTKKTKNDKYFKREVSLESFIPISKIWNRTTFVTKKDELLKVIKVNGFSFETADDAELDAKKEVRNMMLKGIGTGRIALYFHVIRKKQSIYDDDEIRIDPNIKIKQDFTTYVDQEWKKKHKNNQAFTNELYVTVIRKSDTKGAAIVEYVLERFKQKTDKKAWEKGMRDAYEELEEVTNRIMNTLSAYSPKILGIEEKDGLYHSEALTFISKIINWSDNKAKLFVPTFNIGKYIGSVRHFFGAKSIEIRGQSGSKYAGMISIKEYGPRTWAGMFDGFLQMPFEFVMTQSFYFINRQVALDKMQLQLNRMISTGDKAVSQAVAITEAQDMAMSGDIGFGEHHCTVMCIEDNPKTLENSLSLAAVELSNAGMVPIREKFNMEAAFWAQIPANNEFIARAASINTLNMAAFSSMHNYPVGQKANNHWGDYVTVLDTTSGTPYYFNFHLRDVGHTVIIGPTGGGKTVLMNFLCTQAQKFKCRTFFFDKDRGAEIFIRALGGLYNHINTSQKCGFNPFQLPDTPANRGFLLEFLRLLVTINGEVLTSEDISLLSSAVAGNYKLNEADRKLSNIAPFLGISSNGNVASRLQMWYGYGSHAKVFDNDIDTVDFTNSRIFGFEMGDLLRDSVCLAPVLSYLFHRINISLDGTPTMIVLDEAWALIDNQVFAPKIKDWLKVLRKLNAFVVFATQSVEDASKSAISDTLIQQTATQIFLPNLKATAVYKTSFMLSEREFQLIKTTDPGSRYFLVKQGNDAVVARINLAGMNKIISVLSGRSETVLILDEIRKRVGDNPDNWLPEFYEKVIGNV